MKKWLLLFLCSHTYASLTNKVIISDFCELVHRRQYFLGRLKNIVSLLEQIHKRKKIIALSFENNNDFYHKELIKTVNDIEHNRSLAPFFNCWEKLVDYKNIDDELFMKEFTKLTLLITKKLCAHKSHPESMRVEDITLALQSTTYTEAITLRSYYVKRLTRPLLFLSHIKCCKETLFEEVKRNECLCIFESHYPFQHKEITSCIKNMEDKSNLEPLLLLSKEFTSFKLIQDDLFTKEFLLLVFSVYKNLITNNALSQHIELKKSTLDTINHLYENLESLPLENILEAIDLLTEELPKLFEHYNHLSMEHWKERLKKYWWVPPTIIGGIKLILIFKSNRQKPKYVFGAPILPGTM